MNARVLMAELVLLRPLAMGDADLIREYAGAPEIAARTMVPHPYPPEAALEFWRATAGWWRRGEACVFAVVERQSGSFAGCMGMHPTQAHRRAEVGFWIGKPHWGRGLATEALKRLIQFGFDELNLNRIAAGHFSENAASGRVMQKAGMRLEGTRRGEVLHRDGYKDLVWRAILREDYAADRDARRGTKKTAED